MNTLKKLLTLGLASSYFILSVSHADQSNLSLFPLKGNETAVSDWIRSDAPDYDKQVLSADIQQKHMDIFLSHYVGVASPWYPAFVNHILRQPASHDIKKYVQDLIAAFSNDGKSADNLGYGANHRPYSKEWIEKITDNINLARLDDLSYQSSQRGITVDNLSVRALPTGDIYFYNPNIAGQGYPFDNLQMSSLWAGSPVYIIAETRDHAWTLVLTPDYAGWVKSSGIAKTDAAFVSAWSEAATNRLMAITQTETGIFDTHGRLLFQTYVGAVFPASPDADDSRIMVPVRDASQNAVIQQAVVSAQNIVPMPLTATPHHFAKIINTLIGRTYGWGNLNFYNDCSAELKNLFTPFGVWLPRHSSNQVNAGKITDLSSAPKEKRVAWLMEHGQKFLSIVYIGGHVFLYVGHADDGVPMTYQNIWALKAVKPIERRAVIGLSGFFPLQLHYVEDPDLISLADKTYFQVSDLGEPTGADFSLAENFLGVNN